MSPNRPHSERFCDVAVTVKFYCKCDVAKSFRMGPSLSLPALLEDMDYPQTDRHAAGKRPGPSIPPMHTTRDFVSSCTLLRRRRNEFE